MDETIKTLHAWSMRDSGARISLLRKESPKSKYLEGKWREDTVNLGDYAPITPFHFPEVMKKFTENMENAFRILDDFQARMKAGKITKEQFEAVVQRVSLYAQLRLGSFQLFIDGNKRTAQMFSRLIEKKYDVPTPNLRSGEDAVKIYEDFLSQSLEGGKKVSALVPYEQRAEYAYRRLMEVLEEESDVKRIIQNEHVIGLIKK